ncbi:MAG: hypothetical protein WAK22_10640, partial [Candidatus Sulfotelmatobacter sp.]
AGARTLDEIDRFWIVNCRNWFVFHAFRKLTRSISLVSANRKLRSAAIFTEHGLCHLAGR